MLHQNLDHPLADVAVDDWLSHWQPEPGIHVSGVFSETVYETFDTNEEFVEWVLAE